MFKHVLLTILCVASTQQYEVKLRAYFSQRGLHGHIDIVQTPNRTKFIANLATTLQYPEQVWSWSVNEFPVDYTDVRPERCSDKRLGRTIVNLDEKFEYLTLPERANELLEIAENLELYGKSLVLKDVDTNTRICSSIVSIDKTIEKIAEVKFTGPIYGFVYFRWLAVPSPGYFDKPASIISDLYHVRVNYSNRLASPSTRHKWKIFTTDILENDRAVKKDPNCDSLQILFNPGNRAKGQAMGDVDRRVGDLTIASDYTRRPFKKTYRDGELFLTPSDIEGLKRHLYLVIFDDQHPSDYLACARLKLHAQTHARALFQNRGVSGDVFLAQYSIYDPTFVNFTTKADNAILKELLDTFRVNQLPIYPPTSLKEDDSPCLSTGTLFNPQDVDSGNGPPAGYGTQDQYAVGDLTGKYLNFKSNGSVVDARELNGQFWDIYLPLRGPNSILHRSISIIGRESSTPWTCANIAPYDATFQYQLEIYTARVKFRYPIVGSIVFRQTRNDPNADTTIIIEKLVHADGVQVNNTGEHRWAIHKDPPGKDFYDWQNRCRSCANVTNPFNIWVDLNNLDDRCGTESIGHCRLGDLSTRLGTLEISGKNADSGSVRKIFIDANVPLTGPHQIVGKSVVIYADNGPKARGERLACSKIEGVFRRKAVVKDWFPNGDPLSLQGKFEFFQQTEYDVTNIEVDLSGLRNNHGYHVHMTPVETDLEFPCEQSTLYDYWDPLEIGVKKNMTNGHHHHEKHQMGDLSGKFGALDNLKTLKTHYNDTSLPLFGVRSILGRSIIIHKQLKNRRWACATIERGYAPKDAREIRAIASFHHPAGFAYGYVRMTQLIHADGSQSDTIIEVKLRHPGVNDRNVTLNHNWAVFVNPVGVDAAVKTYGTRCVAGGYVWNPYYTQLADPNNEDLYRQECNSDNPLRCYVGDISGRLGPIDLGRHRRVFTDPNLPLEGNQTAVGKSIVIYSPNFGPERFACANIEPDHDIVKFANVEKPPRFVLAQFIEDVRDVLGIPEWMLTVDSRQTKVLHSGGCVQVLMHFKGPLAERLELDFTRLLVNGKLDSPTLSVPGWHNAKRKSVLRYRQCGVVDPFEKNRYYSKNVRTSLAVIGQRFMSVLFGLSVLLLVIY